MRCLRLHPTLLSLSLLGLSTLAWAGEGVVEVEGSPPLSTAYPDGVGPRRPFPLAHKGALDPPPPLKRFDPTNATDGDPATAFIPSTEGPDAWLRLRFDEERFVESVQIRGYGSLDGEAPTLNNRVKALSITPPNESMSLPPLRWTLSDDLSPARVSGNGRAQDSLTVTVDEVYPGQGPYTPISELSVTLLPLSAQAVREALELPEGASMAAIRSPAGGGQYLVVWAARDGDSQRAEMAGVSPQGAGVRIAWRRPIRLQYEGSETLELIPEALTSLGAPALLLTYRFIDVGSTLTYARIYIVGGSGVTMAWETVLSMGEGLQSHILSVSPGRVNLITHEPELGYGMVRQSFRYDPAYRQFEPAPHQSPGVSVRVTDAQGQSVGGAAALLDQDPATAVIVPGRGEGATLRLSFDPPRRIGALQLLPGALGLSGSHTRPAQLTLRWPSGYTLQAELDDSLDLQTLFEGWEGETAVETPWIEITVDGVYPALPGRSMAIGGLDAWFLDPP